MQLSHQNDEKNQPSAAAPPNGIIFSETWRKAFGALTSGCLGDSRALVLLGEHGVGKTALIDAWAEQSKLAFNIVTLSNATGEPDEVVVELAGLMDVDTADLGRAAILKGINASVLKLREAGKETVVVIDDAHAVSANTIELLLVLAREANSDRPMMRFLLSGTPELRKTLRLENGVKRDNYAIVELNALDAPQSYAFANSALAQNSKLSIDAFAGQMLFTETKGVSGQILSTLAELQSKVMDEDETSITREHMLKLADARKAASVVTAMVESGDSEYIAPAQDVSGPDIGDNATLPTSIGDQKDPRPMLRWALGLNEHSETQALTDHAARAVAGLGTERKANSNVPADVNEALAQVAAREAAERKALQAAAVEKPVVTPAVVPPVAEMKAPKAPEEQLDQMIAAEAFTFNGDQPELAARGPVENPNALKEAMREMPPPPKRRGRLLLAAGAMALGVAAMGILWTKLSPVPTIRDRGTSVQASADPKRVPTPQLENAQTPVEVAVTAPNMDDLAAVKEPVLSPEIVSMKSPDLPNVRSDVPKTPSVEAPNTSQFANADTLAPTENAAITQSQEVSQVRMALDAEQIAASLNAEVSEKETLLASLDEKIGALSAQADTADATYAEQLGRVEAVQAELASLSGEQANVASALEASKAQLQEAESRLANVNSEIEKNSNILTASTQNVGDLDQKFVEQQSVYEGLVAKVAAEQDTLDQILGSRDAAQERLASLKAGSEQALARQAELDAKLAEADELYASKTAELDALAQEQAVASEKLAAIETQLAGTEAARAKLEGSLAALSDAQKEKTAELEALDARIAQASARTSQVSAELASAEQALAARNSELEGLPNQVTAVRGELDEVLAALGPRKAELQETTDALAALRKEDEVLRNRLNEREKAVNQVSAALSTATRRVAAQEKKLEKLREEASFTLAARQDARQSIDLDQARVASISSQLEEVTAQKAALESQLEASQQAAEAAKAEMTAAVEAKDALATEVAAMTQKLNAAKSEELQAQDRLAKLNSELEAKQTRLASLAENIDNTTDELAAISSRKELVDGQLAEVTNEGTALLREQQIELEQIQAQIASEKLLLSEVNSELSEKRGILSGSVKTATAQKGGDLLTTVVVPAIRAPQKPVARQTVEVPAVAKVEPNATPGVLKARDVKLVTTALADAPGLGKVSQAKKDELQAALVRGECVTEALKSTFGRVNPHTLVALLQSMEMCSS